MINIKNIKTLSGEVTHLAIPSENEEEIRAEGKLLLLPGILNSHAVMDPEKWDSTVRSFYKGGITTFFEILSVPLQSNQVSEIEKSNHKAEERLVSLGIPIHRFPYLVFNAENVNDIEQMGTLKHMIKGILIHIRDKEELDGRFDNIFRIAAQEDILVLVNAFNENREKKAKKESKSLLENAIDLVEKWSNRLYVLNISNAREIELIQEARDSSLLIYAETTPEHLFQEDLRKAEFLWGAINNGEIESIGTGNTDSGELLSLLLGAVREGKLSMDKLSLVTSHNVLSIFETMYEPDYILVDVERGVVEYSIIQGKVFPKN